MRNEYKQYYYKRNYLTKELIVAPSKIMSTLCNSIFKLEPYRNCYHGCVYCYARKLNFDKAYVIRKNYSTLFENTVRILKKSLVKYFPAFRLSTLTDPFQPIERDYKITYDLLNVADKYDIPLIINTKGTLLLEEPWIDKIENLNKKHKVLLQFSIALLDDREAKIIEPLAPPPSERLDAVRLLKKKGFPVVIRFQPLIPYINTDIEYLEGYVDAVSRIDVDQIISEFLRYQQLVELKPYIKIFKLRGKGFERMYDRTLWELIPKTSHKRPVLGFRELIFKNLYELTKKHGIKFSTCREGFFNYHSAETCCGVHNLNGVLWRKTIYEVLSNVKSKGNIKFFGISELSYFDVVKPIKKILNEHFKTLEYVKNTSMLNAICPHCRFLKNNTEGSKGPS